MNADYRRGVCQMAAELQAIEILDRIGEVKDLVQTNTLETQKLSGRVDVLSGRVDRLVEAQRRCDDHATRLKETETKITTLENVMPTKAPESAVMTRAECNRRHEKQDSKWFRSVGTWLSLFSILAAWAAIGLRLAGIY